MTEKRIAAIEKITVDDGTLHHVEIEPTYINFFFGKNGTGKSTIAKEFGNPDALSWRAGEEADNYDIEIFDRQFISKNFETYDHLEGVFTLSEGNIDIRNQINKKIIELDEITRKGKKTAEARDKRQATLEPLLSAFQDICWNKTENLRKTFAQTQNKKKRKAVFSAEVLRQVYTPEAFNFDEVRKLYDIAYDPNAKPYPLFADSKSILSRYDFSGMSLLSKSITSSSDTDFSRFMEALEATEWVKNGHAAYMGHSQGKCPFCQQTLPDTFEKNIADCFDEQYRNDVTALQMFQRSYAGKMRQILAVLRQNLSGCFPKLDTAVYEKKLAQLETAVSINIQTINDKISAPAKIVELKNTDALVADLDALIVDFNKQIQTNNDIVNTKSDRKRECSEKVWKMIAFVLKEDLAKYLRNKAVAEDEVKRLDQSVKDLQNQYRTLRGEIAYLNSQITNTQDTVASINEYLKDSGLEGFFLRERRGSPGVYEVIREDGKVAENLSEGERNFIAFLYFYHRVRGKGSPANAKGYYDKHGRYVQVSDGTDSRDKIVVIDDPVSGMDSSTLFLVSSLIREMLVQCSNNAEPASGATKEHDIKQIFVLTHNASFYREITYNMVSHYRYVSFFRVDKRNNRSTVQKCVEEAKQ